MSLSTPKGTSTEDGHFGVGCREVRVDHLIRIPCYASLAYRRLAFHGRHFCLPARFSFPSG